MIRANTAAILQKTYDDCHLVCSTAIYFESKKDEAEALRCWKNALDQIAYHNAYRLPSNYQPKSETERALHQSLRQLELQCKERIDLLEALEASRLDQESGNPDSASRSQNDSPPISWLGMGTIPPLSYPDLAKPPPLPVRKPAARILSDHEPRLQPARATSSNAVCVLDGSRSSSPEKKSRFRSTLRPPRQTRTISSTDTKDSASASRPPAASSKAATQAWSAITKSEQQSLPAASLTTPSYLLNPGRSNGASHQRLESPRLEESNNAASLDTSSGTHGTGFRSPHNETHPPNSSRSLRPSYGQDGASPRIRRTTAVRASGPAHMTKDQDARKASQHDRSTTDPIAQRQIPPVATSRERLNRKPVHTQISNSQRAISSAGKEPQREDSGTDISSEDDVDPSEELQSLSKEYGWLHKVENVMANLPRGVDAQAARQILDEVVIQGDEVHWSDIAGLGIAKTALKENVVYPFLRPDLFKGLREPARGILLFGPPGTGKTMLARAVATESSSTFFAISASSLTSKFLGESEKLVRALFSIAKALAPSVIFVDEIDSLLSSRSDTGEHETSRRIKTEFLIQWSDLARAAAGRESKSGSTSTSTGDASRVLVLAATNVPWAIDEAARRRFVRRQYIPLPEHDVRAVQFNTLLANQKHDLADADVLKLVDLTDGFSGSDITALAKDAAMGPLRSLGDRLLSTRFDEIRPISLVDFEASLTTIRPSVSKAGLQQFDDWAKEYGERGG